jgi:HEAT repeat protein
VAVKPTPPPPPGAKPPPTPLARKVPDFDALVERNRAEGLRAIREALASPDLRLRKAAVDTLVDLKGPDVIPILNVALGDSDPAIRIDVLEALAGRGELQTVKKALSDSNAEVREKATELLNKAEKKQTR